MGGLITVIAFHLGFEPAHVHLCPIASASQIDQTICISIGICNKVGDQCLLIGFAGNVTSQVAPRGRERGESSSVAQQQP